MSALASVVVRRPKRVIAVWVLLVAVLGTVGMGLADELANRGYDVPGSDSERADAIQRSAIAGRETTDVLVAFAPAERATRPELEAVRRELRGEQDVVAVGPARTSPTGGALLEVRVALDLAAAQKEVPRLRRAVERAAARDGRGEVVGQAAVLERYSAIAKEDLARAESLSLPITLAVLCVAFLSLVAAGLPVLLAIAALTVTFGLLYLLALATDLSVFVSNTALLLGLGLSIDYSLFMVTRFREGLAAGESVERAVETVLATTGRAVVLSALTVASSLAGMLLVGVGIFSSMAVGAALATAVAAAAAITLVPAVLCVLGPRVNSFGFARARQAAERAGLWRRLGEITVRRRLLVTVAATVGLLVLALPVEHLKIDLRSVSALPADDPVREASNDLSEAFGGGALMPVEIVTRADPGAVSRVVASDPGVASLLPPRRGRGGWTQVRAVLRDEPDRARAEGAVARLRRAVAPLAGETHVGGASAQGLDLRERIEGRTPLVVGAVLALAVLLLTVAFRSIVVPLKAAATTLLSVAATLGVLTFAYQDLGGETGLGYFVPLFLFAIVAGLSIDYEVFLLSRVKEEYDASGDNDAAIKRALVRSGRSITLAALIMITVFAAFAASSLVPFQQLGFGMALAVFLDATVVRGLLVPGALSLLGRRNWWAPRWLVRAAGEVGDNDPDVERDRRAGCAGAHR